MRETKMGIRQYNYHTWSKYMVREPKDMPKGSHYAAVLFGTRTEWTPAYDRHDSDSSCSVPEITYFAFYSLEELETWVAEAAQDKKQFFFYHVPKLGEATIKVSVHTELK